MVQIIGIDRLRETVTLGSLIDPISNAFELSSAGAAESGFAIMYPVPARDKADIFVKTGTIANADYCVVKVAPWYAELAERKEPQGGFVAVIDSHTGRLAAIIEDQHYLSDLRTAAAGAVCAKLFAPESTKTAAILGTGQQAYWQAIALHRERPYSRLYLWGRDPVRAGALAGRIRATLPQLSISIVNHPREAVEASDVIVTTTASREPIVRGEWLRAGQHITAVGADDPSKCELDALAMRRAKLFVDDRDTARTNGNLCRAIAQGSCSAEAIAAEIGEVLRGSRLGRATASDITIANLVGIGALDLAAATAALRAIFQIHAEN